ncbi:MAG: IS200/IS605 family transposase [Bacteroidetes bacterium]|nr:IS200/IS605 family transposase [Bacteroidota bacterium]
MKGTYSQLHVQIIFAVQDRRSLIQPDWEDKLFKYIHGIIENASQKLLCINGTTDHIHIVIGFRPNCVLSDLVREIKKATNNFINQSNFTKSKFNWQEGFSAFSCSKRELPEVIKYVQNQKVHHCNVSFKDEYLGLLKKHEIDYDERFVFDWIDP